MPAGPFPSHPPASNSAICDFTQRALHSGPTRFHAWFRFQNVFQNASHPIARASGSSSFWILPNGSFQRPSTSLNVLRQNER